MRFSWVRPRRLSQCGVRYEWLGPSDNAHAVVLLMSRVGGRLAAEALESMSVEYSDDDIQSLVEERKPLPTDFQKRIELRAKRGHRERELDVRGAGGNDFRLILRQSMPNPIDFSIILAYCPKGTNRVFRLRRYNGSSHEHTNRIEGTRFRGFHIHMATERYQELGGDEDSYAEHTDRFSDFQRALQCVLDDCAFETPDHPQLYIKVQR